MVKGIIYILLLLIISTKSKKINTHIIISNKKKNSNTFVKKNLKSIKKRRLKQAHIFFYQLVSENSVFTANN